jgi:hypothetical protein
MSEAEESISFEPKLEVPEVTFTEAEEIEPGDVLTAAPDIAQDVATVTEAMRQFTLVPTDAPSIPSK